VLKEWRKTSRRGRSQAGNNDAHGAALPEGEVDTLVKLIGSGHNRLFHEVESGEQAETMLWRCLAAGKIAGAAGIGRPR
jgi:hypothetical protein